MPKRAAALKRLITNKYWIPHFMGYACSLKMGNSICNGLSTTVGYNIVLFTLFK